MFNLKITPLLICIFYSSSLFASDSLSYSGRLVNTNGSPVTGAVDLKVELAYSNSPGSVLCSQDFNDIALSNGVFHLKLDLTCPSTTLTDVLNNVPAGQTTSLRVTDVTDTSNPKVYSFQAMHTMPFAKISEMAKQLVQLGASNGQILKWNGTSKKWEPGSAGGVGSVTDVTVSSPLSVSNGTSVPAISISQANSATSGYLSSADWNSFNSKQGTITAGTTAQYYRGDKSWQTLDTSAVAENLANLYFTNARALGVTLTGFNPTAATITASDTVLSAFEKTQGQINAISSSANNFLIKNSTDTITGTVNVGVSGFLTITNPPAILTDATNKQYVDTRDALKVSKAGDTVTGVLTLDNDLKIKGGSNYVTVKGHATSANYDLVLPSGTGSTGQFLQTDGSGNLSWVAQSSTATPTGAAGGDLAGTYPNPTVKSGLDAAKLSAGTVSNTEFDYLDGVTSSIQTQLSGKQSTNANLTSLSSYNTNGILVQTAANTFTGRSVVGTTSRVTVTNSDGVGGNPTIDVSTGLLPSPIAGDNGRVLKATGVNTSAWTALSALDITTALTFTPVNKAGDTVTGVLTLDNDLKIKGGPNYVTVKGHATSNAYNLVLPSGTGTTGQVLQTDGSGNLSWSTPASTATPTGAAGGDLAGTYPNPTVKSGLDAVKLSAGAVSNTEFDYLNGVTSSIQTQLNAKEGSLANGTTAQYYRGDKSWQTLDTLAVPENTKLYFTEPRVLGTVLSGFSATNAAITAADTALVGFNKAQGQITNLNTIKANVAGDTFTGDVNFNTQIKLKNGGAANYVTVKTNAAGTTAYTLSLPLTAGSANQVLQTDGAGVTSWTTLATALPPNGAAGGDLAGTYPNPTVKSGLDPAKLSAGNVSNTEFDYLDGVTSSIQTQFGNKQPLDATLTALAAYSSNGILVHTGVDTFAGRSIAGTGNRITVTNADGVSGNPTLNIDTALLPSPLAGDVNKFLKASGANASAWTALSSSDVTTALGFTPISKTGDSMTTGVFDFSSAAVLRTVNPIGLTDVANKQYVDSFGQWAKGASNSINYGLGNVGIGTTTPSTRLEILTGASTNNSFNQALTIGPSAGGIQGGWIGSRTATANQRQGLMLSSSQTLTLHGDNSGDGSSVLDILGGANPDIPGDTNLLMRVMSTGYVGINTASPQFTLDVNGNIGVGARIASSVDGANNAFWLAKGSSAEANRIGFGINADPVTGVVNSTSMRTNGINRLSVDINGNIGIGASTPLAKIDVRNPINRSIQLVPSNAVGDFSRIEFRHNDNGNVNAQYANITAGLLNGGAGYNSGLLLFHTAPDVPGNPAVVERMRIDQNGNVGIGTVTPGAKFHVNGAIRTTNTYGDCVGGWNCEVYTWDMSVASIYYTGLTQRSDRRLKTNITSLSEEEMIDHMIRLRPVSYDWKNPKYGRGKKFGFIAQEVEEVWPELVSTANNKEKTKSVDYTQMISPLVKTVQKIFRDIASLKDSDSDKEQRIKALEADNASKAKEISTLKKYLCDKDPSADFCPKARK